MSREIKKFISFILMLIIINLRGDAGRGETFNYLKLRWKTFMCMGICERAFSSKHNSDRLEESKSK